MKKSVRFKMNVVVPVDVDENATEEDVFKAAKLVLDDPYSGYFWGDKVKGNIVEE